MKRVVRLYYGFQFFFSLLLWVPIFYEYQKRMGLGDAEIFAIQSIYYIAFCLFEIPTGYLADRWSHRQCMRLGAFVLVIANALPVFAVSYSGFVAHFLLVALARSLISGASSAYLYDYLKVHGELNVYKQAEGNARAYGLIGKVVCWAGVGVLMQWHLSLPYWLSAAASVLSVIFAWALPEFSVKDHFPHQARAERLAIDLKPVGQMLLRSPILVLIMVQGISIFVLGRICQVNLFQPILGDKSFSLETYGVVMSIMTIFEAIGSGVPSLMRRWASDLNSVFVLTLIMAGSLSALAWSGQPGTVAWLSVFALAMGLSFPIQRQLFNDAISEFGDARYRATLLSVESIIDRATCAWVASLLGGFVSGGKINTFLHLSAGVSILGVVVLFVVFRAKRYSLAERESNS